MSSGGWRFGSVIRSLTCRGRLWYHLRARKRSDRRRGSSPADRHFIDIINHHLPRCFSLWAAIPVAPACIHADLDVRDARRFRVEGPVTRKRQPAPRALTGSDREEYLAGIRNDVHRPARDFGRGQPGNPGQARRNPGFGQRHAPDVRGSRQAKARLRDPKFHKGHYYTLQFLNDGQVVPDLERVLRLEESVLRFLTILADEEVTDVEAARPSRPRPRSSRPSVQPNARHAKRKRPRPAVSRKRPSVRRRLRRPKRPRLAAAAEASRPESSRRHEAPEASEETPAAASSDASDAEEKSRERREERDDGSPEAPERSSRRWCDAPERTSRWRRSTQWSEWSARRVRVDRPQVRVDPPETVARDRRATTVIAAIDPIGVIDRIAVTEATDRRARR